MPELNRISASGSAYTAESIPLPHPLQKTPPSSSRTTSRQMFDESSMAATHLTRFNSSTEVAPRAEGGLGELGTLPVSVLQNVVNQAVYEGGVRTGQALRQTSASLRALVPATPEAQLVQWARQIAQPSDAMRILGARTANPQGNPSGALTVRNLLPEKRLEPLKALAITLGEGWPLMERVGERMAIELAFGQVPENVRQIDPEAPQAILKMTSERTREVISGFPSAAQRAVAIGNISINAMGEESFNAYMAYKNSGENELTNKSYNRALNTKSDPDDWVDTQRHYLADFINQTLYWAQQVQQAVAQIAQIAHGAPGPINPQIVGVLQNNFALPESTADIDQFRGMEHDEIKAALSQCPKETVQELTDKYGYTHIQLLVNQQVFT